MANCSEPKRIPMLKYLYGVCPFLVVVFGAAIRDYSQKAVGNADLSLNMTPTATIEATPNIEAGIVQQDEFGVFMVNVPAGTFSMGLDIEEAVAACVERVKDNHLQNPTTTLCQEYLFRASTPAHQVSVEAYWIDQYEVTFGQWAACVEGGGCQDMKSYLTFGINDQPNLPVSYIPRNLAEEYCVWRGGKLPTEAEWEYAARGPEELIYPWGNQFVGVYANLADSSSHFGEGISWDDGYPRVAPPSSFAMDRSWINAYDMFGNLAEFVEGTLEPYPNYEYDVTTDFQFQQGIEERAVVVRGNSFYIPANLASITRRDGVPENYISEFIGFRCVKEPSESMPILPQ